MLLLAVFSGCAQPLHLQYDHGRAFEQTLAMQADRTRPAAVDAAYPLSGAEADAMRRQVEVATGDEESGKAEVVK